LPPQAPAPPAAQKPAPLHRLEYVQEPRQPLELRLAVPEQGDAAPLLARLSEGRAAVRAGARAGAAAPRGARLEGGLRAVWQRQADAQSRERDARAQRTAALQEGDAAGADQADAVITAARAEAERLGERAEELRRMHVEAA